ncbi:MAG: deoxyribonuclease V [Chloroflexi bacterium]|nr:deoxyribonuclease V [Chloroflexota bacterium]MCC6892370.1 deoxyribonuclease V [Anaerolineae bacterium]
MLIPHRHDWNVTPSEAIALQKTLASEVVSSKPLDITAIKLVAGVDVSVKENVSQAAVVILTYPDLQVIETVLMQQPTPFPYIPGLLTYREGPVLEAAFAKLQNEPDVFIFDGMGIMHPRRIGIASHMGVWLQKPTIGCGKSYFLGKYDEPLQERGAWSLLYDKGEVIGGVLRTRQGVKPVYISPGHLADLPTSLDLVMRCTPKYRLPEPIRQAHNAAGQF